MSDGQRPDPLAELRRSDPVQSSPAPSDSKARVWARIQEATMDNPRPERSRHMAWAAGFAAAAVAGVAMTRAPASVPALRSTAPKQ